MIPAKFAGSRSRGRFRLARRCAILACASIFSSLSCTRGPGKSGDQPPPADAEVAPGTPRIVLRWQTETESNTFGYYVWRAEGEGGEMKCLNRENPLHARGTTTTPQRYVYFDLDVRQGTTYAYKLQSKDMDGSTRWIVGADKPVTGSPKPITAVETEEIRAKGKAYREEAR